MNRLYWQYNEAESKLSDKLDRLRSRYVKISADFHEVNSDKANELLAKINKHEKELKQLTTI